MITQFRVRNYKALRDVTLDLTPIHVLIGPNDSGKTSVLDAIAALCRSVDHALPQAFTGSWDGRSLIWRGASDRDISFEASGLTSNGMVTYELSCRFPPSGRAVAVAEEDISLVIDTFAEPLEVRFNKYTGHTQTGVCSIATIGSSGAPDEKQVALAVCDALVSVLTCRWVPRLLGLPVAPDAKRRFRMEPSGFGLALCLDDILSYDRSRFTELEERFRKGFPQIRSIKLIQEPAYRAPTDDPEQVPMLARADGKGLYFEFAGGGELVPASQASDGVLLVLAYLTVLYLPKPPRVVLVEEPENGIHPKRLQDVLKILRDLIGEQAHTQVILATHSPYVVDLFKPEEVTLCQMEEDGSISVHRLSTSKTVREQLDVFTLGEIWTAEGDEALARSSTPDETE